MEYTPLKIYSLLSIRELYSCYHSFFSKGYSFAGESHNFWEMVYIINGTVGITSDENTYIARRGDVVCHAPNSFHSFWVYGDNECEFLDISFNGAGLLGKLYPGKYTLNENETAFAQNIIAVAPDLLRENSVDGQDRLEATSSPDNVGYQIIKNNLELLCLELVKSGKRARENPFGDQNAIAYAEIAALLRENVESMLTIEDVSRQVFISPTKIKQIFRLFTGGGMLQYFNRLKVEHIMELLDQNLSVMEIADRMQFSSPYYLSYFFKRETGMTCREYLKNPNR